MNDSIGAKLKQARELRRLTLQQVSETTKVRPYYLQALENDDLSAISSVAQARGFLRIYAEFLGLSPSDLVPPSHPVVPEPATQPSVNSRESASTISKDAALNDKPAHQGLFSNLLGRFKRPAEIDSAAAQKTQVTSPAEDHREVEEKPSAPAQTIEELPESSVPVVVPRPVQVTPVVVEEVPVKDVPIKEISVKAKTSKKASAKPRKTSAHVDAKLDEKKKADG